MYLQRVGQRNQDQDQNHHRKQKRLQKEKLVKEKNVVPLVKRKASDEKRHRELQSLFICSTCCPRLPIKRKFRNIFPVTQK
jgi:hypothetical protein